MTQALILDRSNALLTVAGSPLIGHALDSLLDAGIKDVVVVIGPGREGLERYLDTRRDLSIQTVEHRADRATSTLGSFAAAAHLIENDVVLIDGDVVFEPAVVSRLMGPGTRLAVDPSQPLDDDTMKVSAEGERIVAISRKLSLAESVGAAVGIAKVDADTGERLFVIARRLLEAGARDLPCEAAFEALIMAGDVFELADVTGLRWLGVGRHTDPAHLERLVRNALT